MLLTPYEANQRFLALFFYIYIILTLLNFFGYLDFIFPHVVLPFPELTDPVEDGIKRTHNQSSSKFQFCGQQHCVEERHHLSNETTMNMTHPEVLSPSNGQVHLKQTEIK